MGKIIKKWIFSIIAVSIAVLVLYYIVPGEIKPPKSKLALPDSIVVSGIIKKMYDIPVDSFIIEQGTIKRDQNLARILGQYNLPDNALNNLLLSKQADFDLRKIRAGNNYTVFLDTDSLKLLRYFVYEHTPIEYVLFDFSDSLHIKLKQKEVKLVESYASGTIVTSLWNSMVDNKINPVIAIELSEIYAWTIDFFGLQPGDSFRVVYNEMFVDTTSVGIEKINTAYFRHANNDFYAIPFIQDERRSFFDKEGNSLRKAFLKAPLRFSRISSKFSNSRLHPILKIRRPHHGVDYSAPVGTPVLSIGDGKVIKMSYEGGAGRMVKIRHNSVYTTAYLHLSGYAKGITTGAYVKQGDVIGYVGSTGLSTGPHLDFRFYKNGMPVDPLKVEAPSVEPISEENKPAFDSVRTAVILKLDSF